MAKKVKKTNASLEIKTPYPEGEKTKLNPDRITHMSDIDHWGEKMVKLQDRVNELELSLSDINNRLKVVTGRMGL